MATAVLAFTALACGLATLVWARSARRLERVYRRVVADRGEGSDAALLARSAFRKDVHTTTLYAVLCGACAALALSQTARVELIFGLILVPVAVSVLSARDFVRESRLADDRYDIERRAEEVLTQDQLAPQRWAARLAPEVLPDLPGFDIGRVYKAGTGLMAGDFFDVYDLDRGRVAAVIGDVTGHGIEPSITALQAKYLLRVFLRQYRDPGQALEELNDRMSALERLEEFISLCVVVFDTEAGTLRWASAGHPTAWLWHDREVVPLRHTGPLLMLDPQGAFTSRELPLGHGDLLLMYTDGLAEARNGDDFFGEERIGNMLRRDPGVAPDVLCKSLLEAAKDFATVPVTDDTAILALRRL
ncbi:PP2C family protein-serine/threonine phosphatase [Iamia sp.]|uniref:PP2C family protein-serine/threonine phosphatase n=1 Tax=Iamia sp. TaxID=2722710 RepID=UPI002CBFFC68|nr:PP2C family protein-serine/threonine phosphatase [Iamia sp.]HXH57989.1 PP2C family protein-serine/threonine phosphatase [Iamia sp.]